MLWSSKTVRPPRQWNPQNQIGRLQTGDPDLPHR
jgi:hypothetical protein